MHLIPNAAVERKCLRFYRKSAEVRQKTKVWQIVNSKSTMTTSWGAKGHAYANPYSHTYSCAPSPSDIGEHQTPSQKSGCRDCT